MWKTEHHRAEGRFVYFIQADGTDRIKIGLANCAYARLKSLDTMCPVPLRLLGVLPTDKNGALEKELHLRFGGHRDRGEWFKADPEIMAYIDAHAVMPPKPRKPLGVRRHLIPKPVSE